MIVQRWAYDGVVLGTEGNGKISLENLKEFVACVERIGEQEVYLHEFGLRATRTAGEGGPHLDWRD